MDKMVSFLLRKLLFHALKSRLPKKLTTIKTLIAHLTHQWIINPHQHEKMQLKFQQILKQSHLTKSSLSISSSENLLSLADPHHSQQLQRHKMVKNKLHLQSLQHQLYKFKFSKQDQKTEFMNYHHDNKCF